MKGKAKAAFDFQVQAQVSPNGYSQVIAILQVKKGQWLDFEEFINVSNPNNPRSVFKVEICGVGVNFTEMAFFSFFPKNPKK